MGRKSKEYWAQRALEREREAYLRGGRLSAKLFEEYQKAAENIRKNISDYYTRYAKKHGLTYEEAMKRLNRREAQEWKKSLEDYAKEIAVVADPKIRAKLEAQLDALSYNSSISRLDALLGQIDMELNRLYERGVKEMKEMFGENFQQSYYHKMYDIQSRVGYMQEFAKFSPETVENIVSYPWSGAHFSDRLWQNKQALIFHLREVLTQGTIQGKSIAAMSKEMSDKMGQSYKTAERLVRTETSHFHNEADKAVYEAAGVEEYEFMATLDERTCEVCGALDGKHFPLSEAQEGVNFPPMHPNDRCTTIEYDPEDALDWAASGKPMPENVTYEEWKKQQENDILDLQDISPIAGEKNLIGRTKETAVVYDENGKVLFRKLGEIDKVHFTPEELEKMRGKIVSHNHPSNGPLSPKDLYQLWRRGLKEIRAVTINGVYSIKQPAQWKSELPSPDKLNAEFFSIFQSHFQYPIQRRKDSGKLTEIEGELLAQRLSMRRLCRKYGAVIEFKEW